MKALIFLLACFLLFVNGMEGQTSTSSKEEQAVYASVLGRIYEQNQETYLNARDFVVLSETWVNQEVEDSSEVRRYGQLLSDFKRVNSSKFRHEALPVKNYHLIDQAEVDKLFAEGEALYKQAVAKQEPGRIILGTEYWIPFGKKYPDSVGLHKLSKVGFDKKNTLALVNVTFESNLSGFSRMYVLKKKKGVWSILEWSGKESR